MFLKEYQLSKKCMNENEKLKDIIPALRLHLRQKYMCAKYISYAVNFFLFCPTVFLYIYHSISLIRQIFEVQTCDEVAAYWEMLKF